MTTADALLTGPRGRRLLLAYAMNAERTRQPEFRKDSFYHAVFLASYHLESGREGAPVMYGPALKRLYEPLSLPTMWRTACLRCRFPR